MGQVPKLDVRLEIEKALQKLKKSDVVKAVYNEILNAIDAKEVDPSEDIFSLKRRFFTQAYDQAIREFRNTWFVSESELHASAVQYQIGADPIPNIGGIIDSKDFGKYKEIHPGAIPFKYGPQLKREWRRGLDEIVIPLDQELR